MLASLDGFMEGPQHELDWFQDGDAQFDNYCNEMIDSIDLALFGRRSYQMMERYWPSAELEPKSPSDHAFAVKMNALPKLVLSTTLEAAKWNNTQLLKDRIGERIAALKREPGKAIAAWGGAGLVSTLSELGLVDEYRVLVQPVLLGAGTPLFKGIAARRDLKLVRTAQLGPNIAMLCYEPVSA
jgi:dihydrofolate reductase